MFLGAPWTAVAAVAEANANRRYAVEEEEQAHRKATAFYVLLAIVVIALIICAVVGLNRGPSPESEPSNTVVVQPSAPVTLSQRAWA